MDEGETIRQLREQNEQLRRENELLKAKISELEARLVRYENAHTPPRLRRGRNRKTDKDNKRKPGQKKGHKSITRPYAMPDSKCHSGSMSRLLNTLIFSRFGTSPTTRYSDEAAISLPRLQG